MIFLFVNLSLYTPVSTSAFKQINSESTVFGGWIILKPLIRVEKRAVNYVYLLYPEKDNFANYDLQKVLSNNEQYQKFSKEDCYGISPVLLGKSCLNCNRLAYFFRERETNAHYSRLKTDDLEEGLNTKDELVFI